MPPDDSVPTVPDKPGLRGWLEQFLPFKIPKIPLPQTAKNFDKAAGIIVLAGGENLAGRIQANTNRRAAQSESEVALIRRVENQIASGASLGDSIEHRAVQYALGDVLRRQENRERVLEFSAEELSEKENAPQDAQREIDSDWLDAFSRYAEQKSNDDVRRIWAKILTAEIRGPGAISLRTLDFLSTINSDDANRIVKAFGYVIDGNFIPKSIDSLGYLTYSDLMFLQELNIVTGLYGLGGHAITKKCPPLPPQIQTRGMLSFQHKDRVAVFESLAENFELQVEALILSQVGRELYKISDTIVPNDDFFKSFCMKAKSTNTFKITYVIPAMPTAKMEVLFQAS